MADGRKTGGRKKGTPNRTTASVKAALEAAFDDIGGREAFAAWARTEPTEFYKLYVKMLPADMTIKHTSMDGLAERLERAIARDKQSRMMIS